MCIFEGLLNFATKTATGFWFGVIIGLDHPHIKNKQAEKSRDVGPGTQKRISRTCCFFASKAATGF